MTLRVRIRVSGVESLVEHCHEISLQREAVRVERQIILVVSKGLLELDSHLLGTEQHEPRAEDDEDQPDCNQRDASAVRVR